MKAALIAGCLLVASPILAKGKSDASSFTEKAHVLSSQRIHTPQSSLNASTGQLSVGASNRRVTEIVIGRFVYTADEICKEAAVGKDYPAKMDRKHIELLMEDGKVCKYRISGVAER